MKTIENEITEVNHQAESKENQYRILKILLDEDYVRTNYYNVLKVITQPGVHNHDKLQRASAVDMAEVKETLKGLHDLGVLEYNAGDGEYTMKKELVV